MKVHIATSRPVGQTCLEWALKNLPDGWAHTKDPEDADVFISVMYGSLVSEEFISKRKCFNFHPGILPAYRGAGAYTWAIINGEKRTGVTLHELDVDIDSGPVIRVETFPIEAWDTSETLFAEAQQLMIDMFQRYFHKLLLNDYGTPHPQEKMGRATTYYRKDLAQAQDLTRFIRAFHFTGKQPAFFIDPSGRKIDLPWS